MWPESRAELMSDRQFDVIEAVEKVAAELGATPTAVSIAWLLGRRGVTSVIIGPRTVEQYRENMTGFQLELPEAAAKTLSDASKQG
jgi:aryl-alcohol dehydrogenase-like predicted oxidoreductase